MTDLLRNETPSEDEVLAQKLRAEQIAESIDAIVDNFNRDCRNGQPFLVYFFLDDAGHAEMHQGFADRVSLGNVDNDTNTVVAMFEGQPIELYMQLDCYESDSSQPPQPYAVTYSSEPILF